MPSLHSRRKEPSKLSLMTIRCIRKNMELKLFNNYLRDENFIHVIKYFLLCKGNEDIQFEACWIFTNIAAGDSSQTMLLVTYGIIPIMVDLLHCSKAALAEQALWTLGNVIGDNSKLRDEVLKYKIIEPILKYINLRAIPISFLRTLSWTIVNLVRNSDEPVSIEIVRELIPGILKLINNGVDMLTRIDALWGLTYIADCGENYIQAIIDGNIIPSTIHLLSFERPKIQLAIIRMLGNIATGTDEQALSLIQNGFLIVAHNLLFSETNAIKRTVLWCLSNISIGPAEHVKLIATSDLMPGIVAGLDDLDDRVVKEATFTIRNIIVGCNQDCIVEIFEDKTVTPLFRLLHHVDNEIANSAHEALSSLFCKAQNLIEHQKCRILFNTV